MDDRPTSFSKLLENIRERVRPACPMMAELEFNELTSRMAEIEFKYRQREIFFSKEAQTRSTSSQAQ